MFRDDPFRDDLLADPSFCKALVVYSQEHSLLPQYLPKDELCVTLTMGVQRVIPCDPNNVPAESDLLPLIEHAFATDDDISDMGRPESRQSTPRHNYQTASSFYMPQAFSISNQWALGTIISDRPGEKYLALMGLLDMLKTKDDREGFLPVLNKFVINIKTGNHYEIMQSRNGYIFVARLSHLCTHFQMCLYEPGSSLLDPGAILGRYEFKSMTACLKCIPPQSLDRELCTASCKRLCSCKEPTLPILQMPVTTWSDAAAIFVNLFVDTTGVRTIYDVHGRMVYSDVCIRRATTSHVSREGLALFKALILSELKPVPLNRSLVSSLEKIFVQDYDESGFAIDTGQVGMNGLCIKDVENVENAANIYEDQNEVVLGPVNDPEPTESASRVLTSTGYFDGYTGSGNLADHDDILLVHEPDRNFNPNDGKHQCHCGRAFAHKHNLTRHVRTVHENCRRFRCEQCTGEFKLKSHLITHIKLVHEKQKPFRCEVCSRWFGTGANLQRHVVETHENTRLFGCPRCSARFNSKHNMLRHLVHRHPDTNQMGNI